MEKMTYDEFYILLENIKKKPALYLGAKPLIGLKHFWDGIL